MVFGQAHDQDLGLAEFPAIDYIIVRRSAQP